MLKIQVVLIILLKFLIDKVLKGHLCIYPLQHSINDQMQAVYQRIKDYIFLVANFVGICLETDDTYMHFISF